MALDSTDLAAAINVAKKLRGLVRTVKVGSILFSAHGPIAIQRLGQLGFDIMLDLKFFDIPSTVELSCKAATQHRISLLTVHACGGKDMLLAAVRGVRAMAKSMRVRPPAVLAVTVLTSVADGKLSASSRVVALATDALFAGCDGVVASAKEAPILRKTFGRRLKIVCPGIRPLGMDHNDQFRVVTPKDALSYGADILVVGRPITGSPNPRVAAKSILDDIGEAIKQC